MTRWNRLGGSRSLAMVVVSIGMSLGVAACGSGSSEKKDDLVARAVIASASSTPATVKPSACPPILTNIETKTETSVRPVESTAVLRSGQSGLAVKRFVVTSGVNDREPLVQENDLPADGTPIFAFAELSNTTDQEQQVRVTFERKGSRENVGNISLTIPPKMPRYRTWAKTRFVREPGTWTAVITNEQGSELGRATFVAGGASSNDS